MRGQLAADRIHVCRHQRVVENRPPFISLNPSNRAEGYEAFDSRRMPADKWLTAAGAKRHRRPQRPIDETPSRFYAVRLLAIGGHRESGGVAWLARHWEIALRKRDSSLVSFSDPAELARVRESFLKKMLAPLTVDSWLRPLVSVVWVLLLSTCAVPRVPGWALHATNIYITVSSSKGSQGPISAWNARFRQRP